MLVQVGDDTVVDDEKILGIQLIKKTNDPDLRDGWWFEILMVEGNLYSVEATEWIAGLEVMSYLYDSKQSELEKFYAEREGEDGGV